MSDRAMMSETVQRSAGECRVLAGLLEDVASMPSSQRQAMGEARRILAETEGGSLCWSSPALAAARTWRGGRRYAAAGSALADALARFCAEPIQ